MTGPYTSLQSLAGQYKIPVGQILASVNKHNLNLEVIDGILSIASTDIKTIERELQSLSAGKETIENFDSGTFDRIKVPSAATHKVPEQTHRLLGQILVAQGLLDVTDIQEALKIQTKRGGILGQILVDMGVVMEEEILLALAVQFKMQLITNLESREPDPAAVTQLPARIARIYHVVPININEKGELLVATDQPQQKDILKDIRKLLDVPVIGAVASTSDIEGCLSRFYPEKKTKVRPPTLITKASGRTRQIKNTVITANRLVRNWFDDSEEKALGKRVFLAMPFSTEFEGVFDTIIEATDLVGVRLLRIDLIPNLRNIWNAIEREIRRADILIADFTGDKYTNIPNPNVVTEATIAYHKYEMPVIIITQTREALFFDWRHQFAIKYAPTEEGFKVLKRQLIHRLEAEILDLDSDFDFTRYE